LALYCWTAPTSTTTPRIVREYGDLVDQFNFTTVAPGGFGTMSFRLRIPDPQLSRPELAMFSRCMLVSARSIPFLGEITQPQPGLDSNGDYLTVTALGIGNALRDDPETSSYTNQTPLQMVSNQLTLRTSSNHVL